MDYKRCVQRLMFIIGCGPHTLFRLDEFLLVKIDELVIGYLSLFIKRNYIAIHECGHLLTLTVTKLNGHNYNHQKVTFPLFKILAAILILGY